MNSLKLIAISLLLLCISAICLSQSVSGAVDKSDNATIWYLGHCGYAVLVKNHLLIFDYQEFRDGRQPKSRPAEPALDNGWIISDELRELSVHIFVSHSHNDHFDPVIFKLKEAISDIHYYIGWKADFDPSYNYFEGPHAILKNSGLEIATINSHHSGVPEVAWLVKVDGMVIYHNGDCQPEDPVSEYTFLKEFTDHIDIAFVPPTYEEDLKYSIQNLELFKRFSPRMIFPMHVTAGDKMYVDFANGWKGRIQGLNIKVPVKMGERFLLRQDI